MHISNHNKTLINIPENGSVLEFVDFREHDNNEQSIRYRVYQDRDRYDINSSIHFELQVKSEDNVEHSLPDKTKMLRIYGGNKFHPSYFFNHHTNKDNIIDAMQEFNQSIATEYQGRFISFAMGDIMPKIMKSLQNGEYEINTSKPEPFQETQNHSMIINRKRIKTNNIYPLINNCKTI